MSEPVGWLRAVVFDAEDPARLSAFWQALVGVGVADTQEGWLQLEPDQGGVYFAFEPVGQGMDTADIIDPVAVAAGAPVAGSPARGVRGRPDIEVEDLDVAQARIEELGGRLIALIHAAPGETHRRMVDPEGNEFTIVLPLPLALRRPAP